MAASPRDKVAHSPAAKAAQLEREVVPLRESLYRHALRMCQNHDDAEDLVQETMVKAYRNFHSFASDSNLTAWLYRIQTNTYINAYRRMRRRPVQHSTDSITDNELATQRSLQRTVPRLRCCVRRLVDEPSSAVFNEDRGHHGPGGVRGSRLPPRGRESLAKRPSRFPGSSTDHQSISPRDNAAHQYPTTTLRLRNGPGLYSARPRMIGRKLATVPAVHVVWACPPRGGR